MKRLALLVAVLAASLWVGGIVHLLVSVQSLFAADRNIAVNAAPILFDTFQWYGLGLGVVTVAAAWIGKARVTALLALVGVGAAVLLPVWVMPAMTGAEAGSEAFKRLHGVSMVVYLAEFAGAAGAWVLLAWRIKPGK